ncbi:MAG: DUF3618 domain-containing protein [Actinobacteria bacterium]|nr:DUF3618 domain-containing protein [Actinomycetota bacterium]
MTLERSPEQIRAAIEENRMALITSVENARTEVARLTDWRGFVAEHKQQLTVAAGVAGFVVGTMMVRRLRRRHG